MNIKAITFDLWQTIIIDDGDKRRARTGLRLSRLRDAFETMGEAYKSEDVRDAYRACRTACREIRKQERDVSFPEQMSMFLTALDPDLKDRLDPYEIQSLSLIYRDLLFDIPPVLADGVLRILKSIKQDGYLVGLISNTDEIPGLSHREFLREKGILDYMDVLTFSDEVGLTKPSPNIFLDTLDVLECNPQESVHVGDLLEVDVLGAKRAGLASIWIEGFDDKEHKIEPDVTIQNFSEVPRALVQLRYI